MTPFLIATLLALAGIGSLALLYRRGEIRRFRLALGGGIAAVAAVVAYVVWVSGGSMDRIDPSQAALSDLRMVEAAGSFRLEGRVLNRSSTLTIASVPIRLVVEECDPASPGASSCRTVFDDSAEVTVTVPPGGSNDFRHVYTAVAGSARSTRRWHAVPGAPRAFAVVPR